MYDYYFDQTIKALKPLLENGLNWVTKYQTYPRGIAQWIKHSPAMQAAGVQNQIQPKFIVL